MSSSNNRKGSNLNSAKVPVPAAEKSKGRAACVKKELPREKPVSKFHDLLMHGVKPWDDGANEFYDSLVEARIDLDKQMDAMDAKQAR